MTHPARIGSTDPPGEGTLLDRYGAEGFAAPDHRVYHAAKRATDIAVATILLFVAAPLLVAAAVAVKLDSSGPVFFRQERVRTRRVRRDGATRWRLQVFTLYKLRSMIVGADPRVHERHISAMASGRRTAGKADAYSIKLRDDARITRVGRYLRMTSIDELPQLFNVLRGEMSIVGPRPVPLYEFARYRPEHMRRFTVLQGISGLWQVRGRCELSFWDMASCDLEYAKAPSYWTDAKIMLRTIPAVVSARGAG